MLESTVSKNVAQILGISLTQPSIDTIRQILQKMRETNARLEEQQIQMLYDFVAKTVELSGDKSLQDEFKQSQKRSQAAITKMLEKLGNLDELSSKDKADIVRETVKQNEKTRRAENKSSGVLKFIGAFATSAVAILLAYGESEHKKRKPTFIEDIRGKKTR
jgi:hypothetical protein